MRLFLTILFDDRVALLPDRHRPRRVLRRPAW